MSGKLGVFGGTFDPIHLGHLMLAEEARERLALDQVLFLPAANPPHKQDRRVTAGRARLEMVELAIAGNPAFVASGLELDRDGVSFTVDTLASLRAAHPATTLFLMLGADNLPELPRWHRWEEILRLARLAVARRPGQPPLDFSVLSPTASDAELEAMAHRVIEIPLIDISSRRLRERVATGRSIRYQVPSAVLAYIQSHGLYRSRTS